MQGKKVVVTAGPTREHLDPVRVLTNPSSGRMGYALAEAAFARGADVILIAGPTELPLPPGVTTHRVETTEQMQRAVQVMVKRADVLIMAAAPAMSPFISCILSAGLREIPPVSNVMPFPTIARWCFAFRAL